tara:strand:+ start:138 stop:434 length:297 start_codon:yes stop_codon:yes gene_type:complete
METYKKIDIDLAACMINDTDPVVVDIRDVDSFEAGHIEGAINLSNNNIKDFISNTEKNRSIIVCCYHGNSSKSVANFLTECGFLDVYSLNGGYEEWKK